MKEYLKHVFFHKWKEVQWDGPVTIFKCENCKRTKYTDFFNSRTYYFKE